MVKFYCPFCDPKYQLEKRDSAGNLYCGLCGEYLVKKKLITIKMIVSIISIFSIFLPILLHLFFSIKEYKYNNEEYIKVKIIKPKKLTF